MGNPRFEDDAIAPLREPDINKVWCKDCAARAKDRMNGIIKGAILGLCEVYPNKPYGILWKNDRCPYYVSDKDVEESED